MLAPPRATFFTPKNLQNAIALKMLPRLAGLFHFSVILLQEGKIYSTVTVYYTIT